MIPMVKINSFILINLFLFKASISTKYHVDKYPTLKFFRNGLPIKREYRGQRFYFI